MDFQTSLPLRLAADPTSPREETTATPETPNPPPAAPVAGPRLGPSFQSIASGLSPFSHAAAAAAAAAAAGAPITHAPLAPDLRVHQAAEGSGGHQFWLKDSKIAEELFTLHRSARHLAEFTASIIGDHDPTTGKHRPIAVMSDGDVVFMTQLSDDIVRSVNGITSIRQHGSRMRKRKIKHGRPPRGSASPSLTRDSAHPSRFSREDTTGSASRRVRKLGEVGDQLQQCYKCGRKETPEWRKGPDGLLCNSCGLVYMKQRGKQKAAEKDHAK